MWVWNGGFQLMQTGPIGYVLWCSGSRNQEVLIFFQIGSGHTAHWDFLPKFLSLHYYTTREGVLGVQRSGQAQRTIICLLSPLFFRQNGITFKKPTKIIKIQWKVTVFWDIFRVCSILAGKQRPKPKKWT